MCFGKIPLATDNFTQIHSTSHYFRTSYCIDKYFETSWIIPINQKGKFLRKLSIIIILCRLSWPTPHPNEFSRVCLEFQCLFYFSYFSSFGIFHISFWGHWTNESWRAVRGPWASSNYIKVSILVLEYDWLNQLCNLITKDIIPFRVRCSIQSVSLILYLSKSLTKFFHCCIFSIAGKVERDNLDAQFLAAFARDIFSNAGFVK